MARKSCDVEAVKLNPRYVFLTIDEVADILKMSKRFVWQKISTGELESVKTTKGLRPTIRVRLSDLDKYLEAVA